MATAKNTTTAPVTEEMVEVFIPKISGTDDQTVWVGLNGKGYSFPRGKRIKVPKNVAEIMFQSEAAQEAADAFEDEKVEESKKVYGV